MHNRILACALALGTAAMLGGCAVNPGRTAEQAWAEALLEDCAAAHGFHIAYSGGERPANCGGGDFESAWNLGEMLSNMERDAAEIEMRLQDDSIPPDVRRDLQRRLVAIERDRPQLEALARMDGYLPPAEVPGSD